jgi:dTDP-4-amino-4,6-dideoxygalactose transaminase
MNSKKEKNDLKKYMKDKNIQLSSHYECLHNSLFYKRKNKSKKLKNSEYFSDNLLRLPIYPDLKKSDLKKIVGNLNSYYQHKI